MRGWITLAIVLVLVVVLGGVLIPITLTVRESGQVMKCRNNLKQLGLAVDNYHDSAGRYPGAVAEHPTLAPERRLSWIPAILPYIECLGGKVLLDTSKAWDVEPNRLPMFRSTTDKTDSPQADVPTIPFGPYQLVLCPVNPILQEPGVPPFTHYLGVDGVGREAAALPDRHSHTGIFGYSRLTRREDVSDGLSTTLLLAETATDNGPWTAGGYPTVRGPDPDTLPHVGWRAPFSSRHSGSKVQVILGDGSVRALAPSISPELFQALCTIRCADPVPPNW